MCSSNEYRTRFALYRLAKIDHSRNTIQLHRLVQAVLRDQLDRSQWNNMRHSVHRMLVNGDPGDSENSANWPVYADLLQLAIKSRLFDCKECEAAPAFTANLCRYLVTSGGSLELTGVDHDGVARSVGTTYYTIFWADIAGYGEHKTQATRKALLAGMTECVTRAFEAAGIPWGACHQESTGDGILVAAPVAVPRDRFAGPLLRALARMLEEHNNSHPDAEQLNLRVALHVGELEISENWLLGPAVVHASRLLDAPPLRKALANSPGPLAVIVSEPFYSEVVWQDADHAPREYRKVRVRVKRTRMVGWVRSPGRHLAPRWREVLDSLITWLRRISWVA